MAEAAKLLKCYKEWGLKETGAIYKQKFGFTDNQWQNIWLKVKNQGKGYKIRKDCYLFLRELLPLLGKIQFL